MVRGANAPPPIPFGENRARQPMDFANLARNIAAPVRLNNLRAQKQELEAAVATAQHKIWLSEQCAHGFRTMYEDFHNRAQMHSRIYHRTLVNFPLRQEEVKEMLEDPRLRGPTALRIPTLLGGNIADIGHWSAEEQREFYALREQIQSLMARLAHSRQLLLRKENYVNALRFICDTIGCYLATHGQCIPGGP